MLVAGLRNLQHADGFADVFRKFVLKNPKVTHVGATNLPMLIADLRCPTGFAMNIRRLPHPTARCVASFTGLIHQDTASPAG
ncbi:hypothetical protein HB771_36625 (plasmid) [Rhizobium leguminosarum bv. viciae]|nr:hypothetical protein HB771_36625 [Rhizobium leguminosarum bv. viciae]